MGCPQNDGMICVHSRADLCQLSAAPEGHGSALQGMLPLQLLRHNAPSVESSRECNVGPHP